MDSPPNQSARKALPETAERRADVPAGDAPGRGGTPVHQPGPEFRRLVEQSPVGTYVIRDGRYGYVNPRLAEILGTGEAELLALESAAMVAVPDDRALVLDRLRAAAGPTPVGSYGFRVIRGDGEQIDVEVHESAAVWDGRPAVIGILLDVTHRRREEAHVAERAFVDPLTRLPNRVRFVERLEIEVAQARRHQRKLAVVCLNLDDFQFVNDSWGHGVGDRLLQSLALRLKRSLREVDTIARIGGDEFLILVPDLRQSEDMSRIAQKLLSLTARPFEIDERRLQVTASAGVAAYPNDGQEAERLLRNADAALHRAKEMGGNGFQLCTPELTGMAVERLEMQNGLRLALEREEFLLHYQPLVSIASGKIVGFEALVRWQHPQRGLVMPGMFIPLAEDTGLILTLGAWVLRAACRQLKKWLGTGLALRMSVNFSARQFRERSLVHTVEAALSEAGLEPQHLEIEITESIAMEGADIVTANLSLLRSMGVGIAIDDFGTGYSSMSYLKTYPITSLKIDRSFVTDLATNPADAGIVRAIVEMAHGSNLTVIAEGVETQEQFLRLQQYGCDEMQGYWVSKPLTAEAVESRLADEVALWRAER